MMTLRVRALLVMVIVLGLFGCVREARIHVSGSDIAAVKAHGVTILDTDEGMFKGTHMRVVAIENDDGTKQAFKPHVPLEPALKAASSTGTGTTLVVKQTDYTTPSQGAQALTLVTLVIVGGVSQVLSYGAILTTQDLIKTPFDQAWYRTTFAFGVGVLITGTAGAMFWLTSRIKFLRKTHLGEGRPMLAK
jgi:hypothetical protein